MRTSPAFTASALLAGALLLTACGTETADSRGSAGANIAPSPTGLRACGLPTDPAQAAQDGVRITAVSGGAIGCGTPTGSGMVKARFRVANRAAQPLTYTVKFEVVAASGEALTYADHTIEHVAPGTTAQAGVTLGPVSRNAFGAHVRIFQVRSVPAAEAPSSSGPCPPSGVRVSADRGDAAMGLRVVGLHLQNCSTRPYRLDGFPQIQLLDLKRQPVTGVSVLHGSGGVSTVAGFDDPARAMTLQPGQSASSGLMWRNTVTDGTSVNVPYVRVTARPGTQPVTVTPELDLGTTGKLAVAPWKKDDAASR
ncbi:DUF4232 domain-containing protein [Streptomyces sp. NBC_01198]|uniref:DUF4232 domain-containing protein n=1 Tax=Streptomyces sp. NBC_01198 TaxID=2903769 RepID=UPI002E12E686|nr:DUF4232 domain-containing protein [Streptomyces sp. NBC_01198]